MNEYLGWLAFGVLAVIFVVGFICLFFEFPDDLLAPPERKHT